MMIVLLVFDGYLCHYFFKEINISDPTGQRVCQQVTAPSSMVTLELSEKAPNSYSETFIVQLCLSDLNMGGIHLRYKYN